MAEAKQFVAGFTTDPHQYLELGYKAREAGFKNIDSTMPYPVHGFEEAYGYKTSWIGWAAFAGLLTGWCNRWLDFGRVAGGMGLEAGRWWMGREWASSL